MIKRCVVVFMCSTLYSCPVLMLLEFSEQIFEKYSSMKFHENPLVGSRVFFIFFKLLGGFVRNEFKIKYIKGNEASLVIFVT
jgi:hypothetical protein